jgi:GWxTD domain-containing protein
MPRIAPHGYRLVATFIALVFAATLIAQSQNQTPLARNRKNVWLDPSISEVYKKWLNEDVVWIATDQERSDFKTLLNDKDRDKFVVAFWESRNPTPGASTNALKEEHYRRIAYANTHFAAIVPGWKEDRGRIYITFGKPDEIDAHPASAQAKSEPLSEDVAKSGYAYEVWRYKHLPGVGNDVSLTFVDTCACGDYHMTRDATDKGICNSPGGSYEKCP